MPCSRTQCWASSLSTLRSGSARSARSDIHILSVASWLLLSSQGRCPALPVLGAQMLDYNVPGGKLNRGMAVYDVLAAIKGAEVRTGRPISCHLIVSRST